MDETLHPEIVQGVETWLSNATPKGKRPMYTFTTLRTQTHYILEKEVATTFLRTLSSHGKRPDPASKAALHRSRVRSAVMTPARKMRAEEKLAQNEYHRLSK